MTTKRPDCVSLVVASSIHGLAKPWGSEYPKPVLLTYFGPESNPARSEIFNHEAWKKCGYPNRLKHPKSQAEQSQGMICRLGRFLKPVAPNMDPQIWDSSYKDPKLGHFIHRNSRVEPSGSQTSEHDDQQVQEDRSALAEPEHSHTCP